MTSRLSSSGVAGAVDAVLRLRRIRDGSCRFSASALGCDSSSQPWSPTTTGSSTAALRFLRWPVWWAQSLGNIQTRQACQVCVCTATPSAHTLCAEKKTRARFVFLFMQIHGFEQDLAEHEQRHERQDGVLVRRLLELGEHPVGQGADRGHLRGGAERFDGHCECR